MPAFLDKVKNALHLSSDSKTKGEMSEEVSTPVFDSKNVVVIFVLGGPGAGIM